jgi:hypothetical protein
MRGESFDRITRTMATGATRRGMLKAFAAGVAAVAAGAILPRPTLAGVVGNPGGGPTLPGQPCTRVTYSAAQFQTLSNCCAGQGPVGSAAWGSCIALGECGQGLCARNCAAVGQPFAPCTN